MAEEDYLNSYLLRKDDLENHLKWLFSGQESQISVTVSRLVIP
jgi:hypothetical protein